MEYIENGIYKWININEKDVARIETMNNVYKIVSEYADARIDNAYKYRICIDILIAKLLCNIDDLLKEVNECQSKKCQDKQEN